MCGRYELDDLDSIKERFGITNQLDLFKPRYNVAPSQEMPVIPSDNPTELTIMRWGLIPSWSRDPNPKGIINARAESVSEKPSFKRSLQFNCCLVPANGFYEWMQTPQGKVPYFISRKGKQLFAFAGITSTWKNPQGEEVQTYAIITCEPNELMATIHNRMPVILREEDEATWLDADVIEPERLLPLLRPYPAEDMEAYPITTKVNSPSADTPDILQPLAQ